MAQVPIADASAQTGIDAATIRDWIAAGRLSEVEGSVDLAALRELHRLEAVNARIGQISAALDQLRVNISGPERRVDRMLGPGIGVLGLLVAGGALIVAYFQLGAATDALNLSRQAMEAQTKAMQDQTAYDFQMNVLQSFRDLALTVPGTISAAEIQSMIYLEQLRLGKELAQGPKLTEEFWQGQADQICTSWRQALCRNGVPVPTQSVRDDYPIIAGICFIGKRGGYNICEG